MNSFALAIMTQLESEGFEAYVVGGAVRDSLLGLDPHDWDVATNAAPEQILEVMPSGTYVDPNQAYPVVLVYGIQVATFRADTVGADRKDAAAIQVGGTLLQDAMRRDLSVNSLYMTAEGKVLDPTGFGLQDIQAKLIRLNGDPQMRIHEDPVRLLRALRLAVTLGFDVEDATLQALKDASLLLLCCRCKETATHYGPCPYGAEICDNLTPVAYCASCLLDAQDEI